MDDNKSLQTELRRLRDGKEKEALKLKQEATAATVRLLLEMLMLVLVISCSIDFKGSDIKGERLEDTIWICSPTEIAGMSIVKLVFDENGKDGSVIFLSRGEERERKFIVVGNEMHFSSPEMKWDFSTDYETTLTVDWGEGETDFVRFISETGKTEESSPFVD